MLTIEELAEHVETGLDPDALALLLAAAYEAIDNHAGASGPVQELLTAGRGDLLMLSRRAASITTIIENDIELDDTDWELRASGQMVRRLATGDNPARRWRGRIDVTYTALDDENERDRVAIALVKLDLSYQPGVTQETIGAWSQQFAANSVWNYELERAAILATLNASRLVLL